MNSRESYLAGCLEDAQTKIKTLEKMLQERVKAAPSFEDLERNLDGAKLVAVKIPDGWELACREIREPEEGEHFLNNDGLVCKAEHHYESVRQFPILKKKWVWPEWLNAACIAMNSSGQWFAFSNLVKPENNGWRYIENKSMYSYYPFTNGLFQLDLPLIPYENWKDSLIINPNRKDI